MSAQRIAIEEAVTAAGGLEAFQQRLGVSRRTVFLWKQHGVPAERAPAVEAATGISRHRLRPDLWPDSIMPANTQTEAPDTLTQNRAGAFALLGALLAAPPDAGLLRAVAALPAGDTALGQSIGVLARSAAVDSAALEREFHDLFIGVGRGEILPYASWYLTGFLHERPLADLRSSLQALGVQRAPGVAEPEDHIAFICETMAGLLRGELAPTSDGFGAAGFYARHLQPWAGRCFADLVANQGSAFYRAVGGFGRAVLDIETLAAELPE
jgi:TorA maturation chaperone TorD